MHPSSGSSQVSPAPGLLAELTQRGLLKQVTHAELEEHLGSTPRTVYAGFDPTANSLHVGSLLPIAVLKRFQMRGHRVLAIVGGATGKIGDPSFKAQERSLLTDQQLQENLAGIRSVLSRLLDLSTPSRGTLLNNADWVTPLSALDFLREVGKYFTVNHMIAKESVRARLEDREHGISYTEFSYMLIQAFDFYHLHLTENCSVQIGGSDQWGNITAGLDLIQKRGGSTAFGLTHPLVQKQDGTKFGKTEQGTIWLSKEKTSVYAFYQFWLGASDRDAETWYPQFSFKPIDEIRALIETHQAAPERRHLQRALAQEMTDWVHGSAARETAERASAALFSEKISDLSDAELLDALADAPQLSAPAGKISLVDALVQGGLCSSKGAARKEIQSGGIYLNNVRVSDTALELDPSKQLGRSGRSILRKGKKNMLVLIYGA